MGETHVLLQYTGQYSHHGTPSLPVGNFAGPWRDVSCLSQVGVPIFRYGRFYSRGTPHPIDRSTFNS